MTRNSAIPLLSGVTVALITSRVRGLPTEVGLDREHGLDRECVANCDNLATIAKSELISFRGSLGPADLRRLDDALRIALGLD